MHQRSGVARLCGTLAPGPSSGAASCLAGPLGHNSRSQPIREALAIGAALLPIFMPILSCAGNRPSNLGISNGGLAPCPSSPNCVSSDARGKDYHVLPLELAAPPVKAWQSAREVVSEFPRTRIVTETTNYLHAECRSLLFRFVDDLELHLRPAEGIIAIRSASRLGYSDFGVNRRRVEDLRASLRGRGVLR
jgi:uncharacterized protein (DUF1499 family)